MVIFAKRKLISELEIQLLNAHEMEKLLRERLKLMELKNEILEWDVQRLKEGLSKPKPEPSMTPLWMDEEEEDILHAKNAGLITPETAAAMLAELEFDNPVVVPDEPL